MSCGTAVSSGALASGEYQLMTGRGTLNSVMVPTGTFIGIYDDTAVVAGSLIFTVSGLTRPELYTFSTPVRFTRGLRVAIFGSGTCTVNFGGG